MIVSLITYYRIRIQIEIGPCWDTFDFLANALVFSGKGFGYSDLTRPPFISFLTSIFFRVGYISSTTIYIVDGLIYIFGVIGLFLLFRLRFDPVISFLGCLVYSSFPAVLFFAGIGLSDIPGVSFSIYAFYFSILAIKKNSKFFLLSFPLIMISFLTRYPAALIVFPILLYMFINVRYIDFKDVVVGILASSVLLMPFLFFYQRIFDDPFYPFTYFFKQTYSFFTPEHFAYNPDILYYITNLTSFIGLSAAIILIILMGIIIYMIKYLLMTLQGKNVLIYYKCVTKKWEISIFCILLLLLILTYGKVFFIITELIFFSLVYITYRILDNFKIKDLDIKLLIFAWFMVFFIFHSIHVVKDPRFFVTMAAPLSYFIIEGLNIFSNNFKFKFKDKNKTFLIFAVILVFFLLFFNLSYLNGFPREDLAVQNTECVSNWLKDYDQGYKNKVIYADAFWPYYSWYLRMNIHPMPICKDGKEYYFEIKYYSINSQDNAALNKKLMDNNVDYYFSIRKGVNLTGYKPVKQFEFITIYEKS